MKHSIWQKENGKFSLRKDKKLSIIKSAVVDFSNRKWEVKNNFQS
jgi:hypothetical protein